MTELGTRKGPDPRGSLSGQCGPGSDLPWVTKPVKDWNGTVDTPAYCLLDPARAYPSCLGLLAPGNLHWQAGAPRIQHGCAEGDEGGELRGHSPQTQLSPWAPPCLLLDQLWASGVLTDLCQPSCSANLGQPNWPNPGPCLWPSVWCRLPRPGSIPARVSVL